MYTYFIVATENEIANIYTVVDVFSHIEKIEPLFGGDISLEAISSLTQIFVLGEKSLPRKTKYSWADGSCFYKLPNLLVKTIASAEWDDLLGASVPWSERKPWSDIEHNRMDLAGMIIDIQSLCKQADGDKSLYILFSNEN